jgi:hypothetical protein
VFYEPLGAFVSLFSCIRYSYFSYIYIYTMLSFVSRAGYLGTVVLLLTSTVSAAGALGIKNGKVAVTSPDGLTDATYTYVPQLVMAASQLSVQLAL